MGLIQRRDPGDPAPPYFYTKLRPEGLTKIIWRPPAPPPSPLGNLTKPGGTSVPPRRSVLHPKRWLLEEVTERLRSSVILVCKEK